MLTSPPTTNLANSPPTERRDPPPTPDVLAQRHLQQRVNPNLGAKKMDPNKKYPGPPVIKVPPINKPLIPPSSATHTTSPHHNDVLCGRGGTINAHPGNEQYRQFVDRKKRVYLTARFKREKRLIAQSIVDEVRHLKPPGRFLLKDAHGDVWRDVGDEKARDKTSQALRENALSVRKQMEEEFFESRRQQARQAAIAAGRDPDEAAKKLAASAAAAKKEAAKPAAKHPPPPAQRLPAPRPGFGPGMPQGQWGFPPGAVPPQQPPVGYPMPGAPQGYPFFQPPPGMQQQQQQLQTGQQPGQPQQIPFGMPPPGQYWPQTQQQQVATPPGQPQALPGSPAGQAMPPPQAMPPMTPIAHATVPSTIGHPSTINPHLSPMGTIDHPAPPVGLAAAPVATPPLRANSPHVQWQLENEAGEGGIPLIIGAKKKTPLRMHRRTSSDHSPDPSCNLSQSTISPTLSPNTKAESLGEGMSHAMTESTPLTFLSGDMSVKTSDSLAHYLQGIEDEISGDVGQEVELVAHAPMLEGQKGMLPPHPAMRSTPPRHNRGSSGRSQRSGSSGKRRKKRSGNRVPSNSGQVQIQFGTSGPGGDLGQAAPAPVPVASGHGVSLPCGDNAAGCGVIIPTPLRGSRSNSQSRSPPSSGAALPAPSMTAPKSPMSPVNSLDLDKMSLCGTENVSQANESIGGASLCNVFDDHDPDSVIGASALMDMTMSLGSHPSSGPSDRSQGSGSRLQPIPLGLIDPTRINPNPVFDSRGNLTQPGGEDASLMAGCAALMDMSVGSSHGGSNAPSKTESKTGSNSSRSGGSSSGKGGRGSPASIDKADAMKMDEQPAEEGAMYAHYDAKFTWDGKREE